MSKHHHADTSYEVQKLINEVNSTPIENINDKFGIIINDDDSVFDEIEKIRYRSLREWAISLVTGSISGFEKIPSKSGWDDDDY